MDMIWHDNKCIKFNEFIFHQDETDATDRNYHPDSYRDWKRRALSIELRTGKWYMQKLNYIHCNPVKSGICKLPEEYKYSSALFYHTGVDNPSASSGRISLSSP